MFDHIFVCLSVYGLFIPIECERHGSRDLMYLMLAAARRVPETVGTQFLFVDCVFHLNYI